MSGEWIKIEHKCSMPSKKGIGTGSEWKCECGQLYRLCEQKGDQYSGYFRYWAKVFPPIIITTTGKVSLCQRMKERLPKREL